MSSDDQVTIIRTHHPLEDTRAALPRKTALTPVSLTLKIDAALDTRIIKIQGEYARSTADSAHAYLLFDGYGSAFLQAQKLSPKSVFQMVVQLATLAMFGYTPACWETL